MESKPGNPAAMPPPNPAPPRSDRVRVDELGNAPGESSSKDSQIDLSPPSNDDKAHPQSSDALMNAEVSSGNATVREFHPWNPHKAAKDIEVGDFYFKRGNYHAAEDRYREALLYKENDALATFRLATSLEKLNRPAEAREEYQNYLKILPSGPQAKEAQKALDRLKAEEDRKSSAATAKPRQ
jgi:tetratricopeptide (TPR) repeat protein